MNRTKRSLVHLLVFTYLAIIIPAHAWELGDFQYESFNTSVSITNYTGTASVVDIPQTILGLPVTTLGEGLFKKNTSVTSITIPNSVTRIEQEAFYYCGALKSITIPENVTYIGDRAFTDCSSLTNIATSANSERFSSVDGVLFDKDFLTLVQYPAGKIGAYAIPEGIKVIGPDAFSYSKNHLTSVTFPQTVTTIHARAFSYCTALTQLSIPTSVTRIWENAFESCLNLTSISIPEIKDDCGEYTTCSSSGGNATITIRGYPGRWAAVQIPSHIFGLPVTEIASNAFEGETNITSVTLNYGITRIDTGAFKSCSNLTRVTIPSGVDNIYREAFAYCTSLEKVTIPHGTSVQFAAFAGCTGLTTLTVSSGATLIGPLAFRSCSNLTDIAIAEGITSIMSSAFMDCTSVTNIIVPDSVESLGDNAFGGCTSLESITIPTITDPSGTFRYYSSPGNATISVLGAELAPEIPEIVAGLPVTSISAAGFMLQEMQHITLPESVTTIEASAFSSCTELTSIVIPAGVTAIGDMAFSGCTNLHSIYFKGNAPTLGTGVFPGPPTQIYYLIDDDHLWQNINGAQHWNPLFTSKQFDENGALLTITGIPDIPIGIEVSTNLENGPWARFCTTNLTDGAIDVVHATTTNGPSCYYRIVAQEPVADD